MGGGCKERLQAGWAWRREGWLANWEYWEGPGHPKTQCHSAKAAFRAAWPLDQELSPCQGHPLYSDPV